MSNPAVQHSANVAAIAIPLASFWARLPAIMSIVLMGLGILYYLVWLTKEILTWKKSWHRVETVTTSHTVTKDTAFAPGPAKTPEPGPTP